MLKVRTHLFRAKICQRISSEAVTRRKYIKLGDNKKSKPTKGSHQDILEMQSLAGI